MAAIGIMFEVRGVPVPKQSTRMGSGGCYTAPEITAWQERVGWRAKQAMQESNGFELIRKPTEVSVKIIFHVPDRRRRDIDNLCKAVLDACNGILWEDDSQVSRAELEREVDAERPGIEIMVVRREIEGR